MGDGDIYRRWDDIALIHNVYSSLPQHLQVPTA